MQICFASMPLPLTIHVLCYAVLPCSALARAALLCPVLPCPALPCPVLPCPALSCLVLSLLVLPHLLVINKTARANSQPILALQHLSCRVHLPCDACLPSTSRH